MGWTREWYARGPQGAKGDKGDPGIPSSEAVDGDTAVGAWIGTQGTQSQEAVLELVQQASDAGGALGWQARNGLGMAELDQQATADRISSASGELARYSDSSLSVAMSDFNDLTGWTGFDGASMSVIDGKLVSAWDSGEGTPSLNLAVDVQPGETVRVAGRITVPEVAATNQALYTLISICHKAAPNTAAYTDRLGVGVNELNQPVIFSALGQSSADAVQSSAPLPAGTYTATIWVDETRVSLTLTSDDGALMFERSVLRSTMTGGGGTTSAVLSVSLIVRDSRKALGVSIDRLDIKGPATRTSLRSGNGWRELHWVIPTASNDVAGIIVPPGYDPRVATPVVIFCHGSGRTALDPGNENTLALVTALASNGFMVAYPNMGGANPWGNPASVDAVAAAYEYLRDHYAIGAVLLLGASAGVLTALTTLRQRRVPGIAGLYSMYGATNLRYQYDNNPTQAAAIEAAYGFTGSANFNSATVGYDPMQAPAWIFRGIPMRFSASPDDTTVDMANNTTAFASKVGPYSPEASVLQGTGAHGDPSQTVLADVLAFFRRALNRS